MGTHAGGQVGHANGYSPRPRYGPRNARGADTVARQGVIANLTLAGIGTDQTHTGDIGGRRGVGADGNGSVALRAKPPLRVLQGAGGGLHGALLLAHIAGDFFLYAEAAEHADRHDGDDQQQQQTGYQHDAELIGAKIVRLRHVYSPVCFITAMLRRSTMVAGLPFGDPVTYNGV